MKSEGGKCKVFRMNGKSTVNCGWDDIGDELVTFCRRHDTGKCVWEMRNLRVNENKRK